MVIVPPLFRKRQQTQLRYLSEQGTDPCRGRKRDTIRISRAVSGVAKTCAVEFAESVRDSGMQPKKRKLAPWTAGSKAELATAKRLRLVGGGHRGTASGSPPPTHGRESCLSIGVETSSNAPAPEGSTPALRLTCRVLAMPRQIALAFAGHMSWQQFTAPAQERG